MKTSFLRLPTVKARTGLSRSSIYLFISQGAFPKSIALGDRAVGWIESEVDEWIKKRIEASRGRTEQAQPLLPSEQAQSLVSVS
jgi:prophage regulatory protein